MPNKSFHKGLYLTIPLLFSLALFAVLVYVFIQKMESNPFGSQQLREISIIFMGITVLLLFLVFFYIRKTILRWENTVDDTSGSYRMTVKKMHNFRKIVYILLNSRLWLPGLKEYVDDEFEGLTYFEVKDFYKGKSKLAIEFLQERHHYADTENLYLELKSLLFTTHNQKSVPKVIQYPKNYRPKIAEKWLNYKCGSGLWYFFGYKYAIYRESLDIEGISEEKQEKMVALANKIDPGVFEDSSFNEIFLSKLGEYAMKKIIPNLLTERLKGAKKWPASVIYMNVLFALLAGMGIVIPLLYLYLNIPVVAIIIGISFVISSFFFLASTFFQFFFGEVDV